MGQIVAIRKIREMSMITMGKRLIEGVGADSSNLKVGMHRQVRVWGEWVEVGMSMKTSIILTTMRMITPVSTTNLK